MKSQNEFDPPFLKKSAKRKKVSVCKKNKQKIINHKVKKMRTSNKMK